VSFEIRPDPDADLAPLSTSKGVDNCDDAMVAYDLVVEPMASRYHARGRLRVLGHLPRYDDIKINTTRPAIVLTVPLSVDWVSELRVDRQFQVCSHRTTSGLLGGSVVLRSSDAGPVAVRGVTLRGRDQAMKGMWYDVWNNGCPDGVQFLLAMQMADSDLVVSFPVDLLVRTVGNEETVRVQFLCHREVTP
jgi:hypothetical protein